MTKFRHMKGTPLHKSKHFENLKNLSKALPAECDFIQVRNALSLVKLIPVHHFSKDSNYISTDYLFRTGTRLIFF